MGMAESTWHVVGGKMAEHRTLTLSALWGSMSQSSTSTTCAATESRSERQSGSDGSGIVFPAHCPGGREEQSSRVASSDSCESEDDSVRSRMEQNCPPRKKRKQSKLSYQKDWKWKYLMLPASCRGKLNDAMICVQCHQQMKAKSSTALRHISRRHPDTLSLSLKARKEDCYMCSNVQLEISKLSWLMHLSQMNW